MKRLQDRVAIITGGGSGIGRATALLFASEGAKLCIVDRYDDAAESVAADIRASGGEAITRISDVGVPGTAEADAAACLAAFGRVDVLMTAAGLSTGGTATTITPENWDLTIRVNLTGTWLWLRAVLPTMQNQGSGSIITVASQLARSGGRNNIAYITAKAGILGLTKTTALDYVADGIRVNTILPGAIETPMLRRSFARSPTPEATREASRLRHPMGRFGRDEEVAQGALYLASDASTFTTGTELVVDGGWLAG